jgi:hypothetical protein
MRTAGDGGTNRIAAARIASHRGIHGGRNDVTNCHRPGVLM